MDDDRLRRLAYDSLFPFYELMAGGAPTSRLERRDGVTACVVPAVPQRSFMNSVLYESAADLEPALGELQSIYDTAGVAAWTVWVRTEDRDAAEVVERAGHTLDAQPAAMAMPLDEWEPLPGRDADIGDIGVADVTRINDIAYGWNNEFVHGLVEAPAGLRMYGGRLNGKQMSCAAWMRNGDDCSVYMVASLPEARGRGLATDLMIRMLTDARSEGCTTTTLQASPSGHPIYLRLGYRDLGRLQMWERRR